MNYGDCEPSIRSKTSNFRLEVTTKSVQEHRELTVGRRMVAVIGVDGVVEVRHRLDRTTTGSAPARPDCEKCRRSSEAIAAEADRPQEPIAIPALVLREFGRRFQHQDPPLDTSWRVEYHGSTGIKRSDKKFQKKYNSFPRNPLGSQIYNRWHSGGGSESCGSGHPLLGSSFGFVGRRFEEPRHLSELGASSWSRGIRSRS